MNNKIKILFVLNHFQFSDGVAATLRSLIQNIDKNKYELHLLPLYKLDHNFLKPVESMVTVHRGFGFYFRGMSALISKIPLKWLYHFFVKDKYDIEVAYQYGLSTKMISISPNPNKICWMHTYDSNLTLRSSYCKFPKIVNVAKIGSDKLHNEGFSQADYCYNIIDEENIIKQASEFNSVPTTSKKIVITVCRIDPDKAILRQIKCIEKISGIDNKYEFWIVGNGTDFPVVQDYVSRHRLESYIKLFGSQNNPYKYLVNASLYFCGSLREGFSTACQEAAILGIPVVSTDVDGAKELIEIAECGEVIPNNEEAITERLTAILSDNELIKHWKEIAQNTKSKFFKENRIAKIEKVLIETLF